MTEKLCTSSRFWGRVAFLKGVAQWLCTLRRRGQHRLELVGKVSV